MFKTLNTDLGREWLALTIEHVVRVSRGDGIPTWIRISESGLAYGTGYPNSAAHGGDDCVTVYDGDSVAVVALKVAAMLALGGAPAYPKIPIPLNAEEKALCDAGRHIAAIKELRARFASCPGGLGLKDAKDSVVYYSPFPKVSE